MNDDVFVLLERFEALDVDAASFTHLDHIKTAYAMLKRYDFLEAASRYSRTIDQLAQRVGAHDKFNLTITLAFLSLMAERMSGSNVDDFGGFLDANPDLMDRGLLSQWYSRERLNCAQARRSFLLPDVAA